MFWGSGFATALCDVEAVAPPGCSECAESCLHLGHLPRPHWLPLRDQGQPDSSPRAPLNLWRERGNASKCLPHLNSSPGNPKSLLALFCYLWKGEKKNPKQQPCRKILQKKTLLLTENHPLCVSRDQPPGVHDMLLAEGCEASMGQRVPWTISGLKWTLCSKHGEA